jgi:hypothetical protein
MTPFSKAASQRRTIKAIDTQYRGFLFRSRLEAKWANFLDLLKVPWDYEAEGLNLDGEFYLPDFWLPRFGMFLEIKGTPPTQQELLTAEKVRDLVGNSIAVVHGYPTENIGVFFTFNETDSGGGIYNDRFKMAGHPTEGFQLDEASGDTTFGSQWDPIIPNADCRFPPDNSILRRAALLAKQARFEHGADPTPPWLR